MKKQNDKQNAVKKADKPVEQEVQRSLTNDYCSISIDAPFKEIIGRNLKDLHNLPTFYNITNRGLKNAWLKLAEQFHENMTMYEAMQVFTSNGVRCRSYCAMD